MTPLVFLTVEDYILARLGNRAEDYDPSIAEAAKTDVGAVWAAVEARGGGFDDLSEALRLTREVMLERYETERIRRTVIS